MRLTSAEMLLELSVNSLSGCSHLYRSDIVKLGFSAGSKHEQKLTAWHERDARKHAYGVLNPIHPIGNSLKKQKPCINNIKV